MKIFARAILFYTLAACVAPNAFAERFTLLEIGAVWSFLNDGSDQGSAWRQDGFDDSSWGSGPGPLGHNHDDIATDIGSGSGVTAYFRTEFDVSPEILERLERFDFSMKRDDGAAIYLNGVEIRRDNLPDGELLHTTLALGAVSGTDEQKPFVTSHPSWRLLPGTNTLAVEIHKSSAATDDPNLSVEIIGDEEQVFLGSSRPPAMIDFETPDYTVDSVTRLDRNLDPDYTGIEYTYEPTDDSGNVFRSPIELLGMSPFESTVLAGQLGPFRLDTGQIDISNYSDVRASFDLRVAGRLDSSSTNLTVRFGLTSENLPETIQWRTISVAPPQLVFTPLFPENAQLRYQVPTDPQIPIANWTAENFNDSGWTAASIGIGYERSNKALFSPFISTDLEAQMYDINASVNLRIPFTVNTADVANNDDLYLKLRYDDGFVAWLNGVKIARRNAPEELEWDSEATVDRADSAAIHYNSFVIPGGLSLLHGGVNLLAIRGLNRSSTNSNLLVQPQLDLGRTSEEVEEGSLGSFRDEFTTIQTDPNFFPDDTTSLSMHIENTIAFADNPVFYIDNIQVTGSPIEPDSFSTALALDPGLEGLDIEADPDPDGDGIPVLLEYAFGGSFLQADDSSALLPKVDYDEQGFMTVQFRILDGLRLGDTESGFDVADLRYTPQLSYDLHNWGDLGDAQPFVQVGEIVKNGDGTSTVSIRSQQALQSEKSRAYFRLQVGVVRPPQVVLVNGGS